MVVIATIALEERFDENLGFCKPDLPALQLTESTPLQNLHSGVDLACSSCKSLGNPMAQWHEPTPQSKPTLLKKCPPNPGNLS